MTGATQTEEKSHPVRCVRTASRRQCQHMETEYMSNMYLLENGEHLSKEVKSRMYREN
jgi:hypothetical protein